MINKNRAKEIYKYFKEHGQSETMQKYHIGTESTLNRYIRHAKQHTQDDSLTKNCKRYVIAYDFHVPFHNKILVDKLIKYIDDTKPDGLVIAGDFLDLFSLSKYAENSLYQLKHVTLGSEYDQGNEILDKIDLVFRGEKHYLYGNHENRFFKYLERADNAKLLGGLRTPTEALKLTERNYSVIEDYPDGYVKLGKHLEVIHGVYANEYAAKQHLMKLQTSVIFGHIHRRQSYGTEKSLSVSSGGLFDKESEGFKYVSRAVRSQWSNGFDVVAIDSDGYFYHQGINCYNNKFFADGKLY